AACSLSLHDALPISGGLTGGQRRGDAGGVRVAGAAVRVGGRRDLDVPRPPGAAGTVELVRADVDERAGVAVVAAGQRDDAAASGDRKSTRLNSSHVK